MTATLISSSVTPGASTGTFFFRSAALAVVPGPWLDGSVVEDDSSSPALPHATVSSAMTAPTARILERIGFPPSVRAAPARCRYESLTLTSDNASDNTDAGRE